MSINSYSNLIDELESKSPDLVNIKKTTDILEAGLGSENENFQILKSLGHCYLIQSNISKAHQYYQKALLLQLEDSELWYGIGLMYYKSDNFKYAEPSFLKVIANNDRFPQRFLIYFKLGLIFKRFSYYTDALNYFNKCLEGNQKIETLCQLGFCYNKLGLQSEALSSFKLAHESGKTSYTALCLGLEYLNSDTDLALSYLNEGLALCKNDTIEELDVLYFIGRVFHKRRDMPQASNYYLRVINKNPSDFLALNSFGILCAETGQSAQAFRCLIKASEISKNSFEIWNNIGCLYWMSGQVNESKMAFDKAKELSVQPDLVKDKTKEFIFIESDISEFPFAKRKIEIKAKPEPVEPAKPQMTFSPFNIQQTIMNNYAAFTWYFNMAKQCSAIQGMREKTEEDNQAAQILSDLSMVPAKRHRDKKSEGKEDKDE